MKINIKDFRVAAGKKVRLSKWPTQMKPGYKSKIEYKAMLAKQAEKLFDVITGFEAPKAPAHGKLHPA